MTTSEGRHHGMTWKNTSMSTRRKDGIGCTYKVTTRSRLTGFAMKQKFGCTKMAGFGVIYRSSTSDVRRACGTTFNYRGIGAKSTRSLPELNLGLTKAGDDFISTIPNNKRFSLATDYPMSSLFEEDEPLEKNSVDIFSNVDQSSNRAIDFKYAKFMGTPVKRKNSDVLTKSLKDAVAGGVGTNRLDNCSQFLIREHLPITEDES